MHTKLHINISQGVVDVEGDPDLVREVYADFKDKLLTGMDASPLPEASDDAGAKTPHKAKPKRRSTPRKKSGNEEAESGVSTDSPKMDKHLDTSKLPDFYVQFETKNNAEKILVYLKFLIDNLDISAPNTDQVFTCFKATGEKIPKAFPQAFYDMSSKQGYIDFNSSTDISITIAGENHFNHNLQRKTAE